MMTTQLRVPGAPPRPAQGVTLAPLDARMRQGDELAERREDTREELGEGRDLHDVEIVTYQCLRHELLAFESVSLSNLLLPLPRGGARVIEDLDPHPIPFELFDLGVRHIGLDADGTAFLSLCPGAGQIEPLFFEKHT